MARRAPEVPNPAVVVVNPDDDITPEAFAAWLRRRRGAAPLTPAVTAAETLAEIRAEDEE
jgi:hypothetical protein